MKKFLITFLILATLLSTQVSSVAIAATEKKNIKTCVLTYTKTFPQFIETVIAAEGFYENFLGYFVDLVSRSACQLSEILTLDAKLDAITKQIQKAYFDCKGKEIPALEKKYIQAKAEIYYVRHIVNMSIVNKPKKLKEILGTEEDLTVKDIENNPEVDAEMFLNIKNDMAEIYEPQLSEGEDFNEMFEEIEAKFQTRKYEYLLCGEWQVWQQVSDKWKEFKDNWGGTKDAIKDTGNKIVNESMNVKKSAEEMKLRYKENASKEPAGAFKNFMENTFKTSINSVDPATGLTEIIDNAKTYLPGTQTPTMSSLFDAVSIEEERYTANIDIATVEAKYMALYAGTTDAAVAEFTNNLDLLLATLTETAKPLTSLQKCISQILGKHCQ